MDLASLRLRLSEYLNDSSTNRWSQATRDQFINIAYKQICNVDNWPFREVLDTSITTVGGTSTYAFPTDMQLPLGIWHTAIQAPNLLYIATRDERRTFAYTGQGKPFRYFLFGKQIQLYPTPDTAYNLFIEYQTKIDDLVLSTDIPVFDEDFHYLIALLAAAKLKKTSGGTDVGDAENLIKDYEEGVRDMQSRLMPKDLDRKKQVDIVWDTFPPAGMLDIY